MFLIFFFIIPYALITCLSIHALISYIVFDLSALWVACIEDKSIGPL